MTDEQLEREKCERDYKTAHLPETVRDAIWYAAYEEGHASGIIEVVNCYGDHAHLALLAYEAALAERDLLRRALEDALRASQTVDAYDGVKNACKRGEVVRDLDHKAQCEAEHGTAHLPEDVRASVYRNTDWETGYEDTAEIALLAFKAGRESMRGEVCDNLRKYYYDRAAAQNFANLLQRGEL